MSYVKQTVRHISRSSLSRSHVSWDQQGFTLIELLVAIALIGILTYLGFSSLWTYRNSAGLAVASQTIRNARTAVEAGVTADVLPPAVSITQTSPGGIQDADAREYLPGMQIPKQVKFSASYDPDCLDETCESDSLEVRHCLGRQYVSWMRTGDGIETPIIISSGSPGCP